MFENMKSSQKEYFEKLQFFSITIDESSHITDTAQLAEIGLQFSISGGCKIAFKQLDSAASRKAPVDTQNVELNTRI